MNYPALKIDKNNQPEYKTNPLLPISSVGTDYTTADQTHLPVGSALMTDTLDGSGNGTSILNSKGITHIIHAAPNPRSSFTSDQHFINCVVKSVQNSIILADRIEEGSNKLAICLVGGGIFRGSCDPWKLVEGIIRGAINQLEKCNFLHDIVFLDWARGSERYFLKKIKELENELFTTKTSTIGNISFLGETKGIAKGVEVKVGEIYDKSIHDANFIVNAANTEVKFGRGISGDIKSRVGNSDKIDRKARELIGEFYSKIDKKGGGGNNDKKITFQAVYTGPGPTLMNDDNRPHPQFHGFFLDNNFVEISTEHPIFKNPPFFWKDVDTSTQKFLPFKITIKETDKGKKLFRENDFVEIEEIKTKKPIPDKGPPIPTPPDTKTASEWQAELKAVDNDMEQIFTEDKVNEWKMQGKSQFGTVEGVKKIIQSIKGNSQFLNLIKTKKASSSLGEFFAKNNPPAVIETIKRFEYDNSSNSEKETRNKKMRKYYGLEKNVPLTDEQINEFCYKVGIGEIIESAINENEEQIPNNTKNPESNILKIVGIGALILIPLGGLLLILFIRNKRKKLTKK